MSEFWMLALAFSLLPTIAAMATYQQGTRLVHLSEQIHKLTNSNLTKVLADLEIANDRIEKLEKLISKREGEDDAEDKEHH